MAANYKLHRLWSAQSNATFRKAKGLPKEFKASKKSGFADTLGKRWRFYRKTQPDCLQTLDFQCEAIENYWLKSGVTFFPEDGVCERLIDGKFDLAEAATLDFSRLPFDTFQVSIPQHIKFAGFNIDAVIIEVSDMRKYNEQIIAGFVADTGMNVKAGYDSEDLDKLSKDYAIQFVYREPDAMKSDGIQAVCMSVIRERNIAELLSEQGFDGAKEFTPENGYSRAEQLCSDDHEIMIELDKFVLKLIIYLINYPEAITDGAPPVRLNVNPLNPAKNRAMAIGGVLKGKISAGTYRRAHFRNLRHKKYYQGDYAELRQGSRWVYVSEHEEINAKTITNEI